MNRRISLVTGWAGGIGTAIVRWFRKAEWSVNRLDRQWCPGGLAVDECLEGDGPSSAVWNKAVNIMVRGPGRLATLVNNAALQVGKPLVETPLEGWDAVMGRPRRTRPPFPPARAACWR